MMNKNKLVGEGNFAKVYLSDCPNKVIRVSKNFNDGFSLILKNMDLLDYNKIVKIYSFTKDLKESLLEKLDPLENGILYNIDWEEVNEEHFLGSVENQEVKELLQYGIDLYGKIYQTEKVFFELDLRPENIMLRKNGTLVLSDPFGYVDF